VVPTGDPRPLPRVATPSRSHDVDRGRHPPIADNNDEAARLTDLIEGVAGELSTFEELHGFGIDGVDLIASRLRTIPREPVATSEAALARLRSKD
jgi:hypothetical protein